MPLLCVVARYGSAFENSLAKTIRLMTASPLVVLVSKILGERTHLPVTTELVARFDKIAIILSPPVNASIGETSASRMVFSIFAPMASFVSTDT